MSEPILLNYSPLGWGQWVYGPFLLLTGLFLGYQFYVEVMHKMANGGFGHSSIPFEFWFGIISWSLFALVSIGFVIIGGLFMSFDRLSTIENDRFVTHRGKLIPWHNETFNRSDVVEWKVEDVVVMMVFGPTTKLAGSRWKVVAVVNKEGKQKEIIVDLEPTKEGAEKVKALIMATL